MLPNSSIDVSADSQARVHEEAAQIPHDESCITYGFHRAFVAGSLTGPARGDFPTHPVRVIVGFPAGSAADITARVVGQRIGQLLGQQVVIENKSGAGSNLAAEAVARAPKDGYTLLLGTIANSINAVVKSNLAFDFPKDFMPIIRLTTTPNILVVHPSLGVKSVKELIDLAKAKPDQLLFASSGVATGTHLAAELFKMLTGTKMVHVPYAGSPPAITDLLAGRVQVFFSPASTVLAHVRSGKLVALASTEAKRTAIAPELPTMAEAGLPSRQGCGSGYWRRRVRRRTSLTSSAAPQTRRYRLTK
jgi:tripartite-type tricarboxylate transporter receptor subunit TctC